MLKENQNRVAHLVRKLLPPFSIFIRNQIINHKRYDACVIYKEYIESDFADEIINTLPAFYCENGKKGIIKNYSKFLYNKPFRRLTLGDKKNIRKFLIDQRVDILHFHYGTDAGIFIDVAKHINIPSVVSFYGYDCSSFPHWYFGYGVRYLHKVFKYTSYCLAMSEDMKLDLQKFGCPENKIIIHYYGTDVSDFYYERKYETKDETIFLVVASLVPQKGHIFLLQAFAKARQLTCRNIVLRVVGTGYLESELREFVNSNGLNKHVHFAGPLKHLSKEFINEFYNADVFIHPSVVSNTNEKEGIPGAIIEAMATGLPVISTYHAGIPYVIHHMETGLLVNEWDINTLAEYICILAEDSNLRRQIGQKAQQYALEKLDLKQKEIELESIYDFVIENHSKSQRRTSTI